MKIEAKDIVTKHESEKKGVRKMRNKPR